MNTKNGKIRIKQKSTAGEIADSLGISKKVRKNARVMVDQFHNQSGRKSGSSKSKPSVKRKSTKR